MWPLLVRMSKVGGVQPRSIAVIAAESDVGRCGPVVLCGGGTRRRSIDCCSSRGLLVCLILCLRRLTQP